MATASYTFSTGVPNINPAVYAANDVGGSDLNTTPTATDSNGVLTLTLDIGDYVAQWSWEGDTHQTTGEVASPNTLGEVAASSGASVPVATLQMKIGFSGDLNPYMDVTFPLDTTGFWTPVLVCPHWVMEAGWSVARGQITGPDTDTAFAITDGYLQVSNAAGTEVLIQEVGAPLALTTPPTLQNLDFPAGFTALGTDLSYDSGTKYIVTAAGGAYAAFMQLYIQPA